MSGRFEELAWQATPMGELSLRRRRDPVLGADVYEVKLDEDYLMSSMFTAAEIEIARLALARLALADGARRSRPDGLTVAVGGLGLGYTAQAVLASPAVAAVIVIEAHAAVIDWHRRGLVPAAGDLTGDPRCRLVEGDFFALSAGASGLDPEAPGRLFDAIIVDIDHSPGHLLHPGHAPFYGPAGTRRLAGHLRPDSVFALWSNDPPDPAYHAVLAGVFATVEDHVVRFPNPLQGRDATNTVYLATSGPA
jgi:spermidine synthase